MEQVIETAVPNHPRVLVARASCVLLAVAAMLFAGCIRGEVAVRVADDGSGTVSVLYAFDRSLLEMLGSLDEDGSATNEPFDPESVFDGLDRDDLPAGSAVQPYDQDGFVGARVTAPFERIEEARGLLDRITSGATLPGSDETDAESESGAFEQFDIQRTEDGWRFDAVVQPSSTGTADSDSTDAGDAELAASLFKDASFTVTVALPGTVREHNADRVDGGELAWDLDLLATEPRTLSARTTDGGDSGFPWPLLAIGGAGVLGIGAVMWDVRRRRRHTAV
jgi:hypothetical protein